MQERFKEFILNDIFWFNKSELNFGIYKIFRQKENFIKEKLDEIVGNIETQLSSNNEQDLLLLKKELKDNFIPPKFQIDTLDEIEKGIKKYCNGNTDEYLQQLEALKTAENYDTTKVYEYLYQFFNLYYEKGDFGYTPRSFRTYSIPYQHEEYLNATQSKNACETSSDIAYSGEETLFSWKTKDSYYIKSNKFLNSVSLNLSYKENDYTIHTNIINKDEDIKDDKKVKQYRLVSIKKENNHITLNFNISDFATPKHTIYLMMLSVIEENIAVLDYDTIFQDKKLRDYFENLPLKETTIQTSLLDETQSKLQERFVKLINDETVVKYIIDTKKDKEGNVKSATNIFKYALSGEEDKTQLKSKTSKLMVSKKEYASKLYSNTTAKEFLEVAKKEKFDIEDKKDYEKLYENDAMLNFFYRLDRGVNLFYAGVDSDYFIHKNLKRFLSVELDKFIKNYIFADTDTILLMDENAKKIATFARVFKAQANVFIGLLSSIEEFQKYLWEKRKMVKSSHYVVSSNKIEDTKLLEMVLKNRNQLDEWKGLGITKPNEKPNIIELQSYSYPIDTKHFDLEFKYKVLSQFENIEDELSGLLIKSENYQALKFLEPKYIDKKGDGKIKCVYIDPPYNTGNDGFVYKDSFKSASWLSMMSDRLEVARGLMRDDGVIFTSIDDNQLYELKILKENIFKEENFIREIPIVTNLKGNQDVFGFAETHEYFLVSCKNKEKTKFGQFLVDEEELLKLWLEDEYGLYKVADNLRATGENAPREKRPNLWYPIFIDSINTEVYVTENNLPRNKSDIIVYPINPEQEELSWYWGKKTFMEKRHNLIIKQTKNGWQFYRKQRPEIDELPTKKPKSFFYKSDYSTSTATNKLKDVFNEKIFKAPKPIPFINDLIQIGFANKTDTILDFFAGSGTTPHAVINLNREDNGKRKFIAVEMNDYFETIILPRIKKVSFSTEWKEGKAQDKNGYSSIFQYIELEQYDDIIDNLEVIDKDIAYDKAPFDYIYQPDKNQIAFRMDNELNNPLNEDAKVDIFSSLIFHEGLELITINLDNDVLEAKVKDRYSKECYVVLGSDKTKVQAKIDTIKEDGIKIYTNHTFLHTEQIMAETFKGK